MTIKREHIDEYLATRRAVLWGQNFDVYSEDGRERATEWLSRVVDDLHRISDLDGLKKLGER